MHSDRLTRQELTWLLTQEARSAAEKLRKGVAVLSTPEIRGLTNPPAPSVETELDALDDAMKMLATLHTGGATRSRRGRIDLAALLWEVAPNARVSIEPGSGTEVFGDESELRRMLQVLVGSINPASSGEMDTPELAIRREGAEIRISVTLGPDSSANAETERAWLGRMATRYGGRLELLPADGADQREVADLRRELEAAQRQGEAYARELAAVFAYSQTPSPRFSSQPIEANRTLGALCAMAAGMSAELRNIFSAIERDLSILREAKGSVPDSLAQHSALGNEIVTDLVRIGQCPVYESVQHLNLADVVRATMAELDGRASKRGVTLKGQIPGHLDLDSRPATVALLIRTLLNDAILATPRGGQVTVSIDANEKGATLAVRDDGPPIPEEALGALLATRLDPTTLGRPSTIALFWAHTLAQHLGTQVELGHAAPQRGCLLEVKLGQGS